MGKIASKTTELGTKKTYDNGDESYIIRLNDPKEGKIIEAGSITNITINENLFSLLPTLTIEVEDQGAFFEGYNLKNGDVLYFTITPNINVKGEDPEPYVYSEYVIQNIECTISQDNSFYYYTIICVFDSLSYLNEIDNYPKETPDTIWFSNKLTSDEAIREVLDDTRLLMTNHVLCDDYGLWINCNKTRAEFIDKIVDHAWIAEDDAPILYTNLNGDAHYTSIKTLAGNKKLCTFMPIKKYNDLPDNEKKESLKYPYTSMQYLNAAGPILNQGGYKVRASTYTPYNLQSLWDLDLKAKDFDMAEIFKQLVKSKNLNANAIIDAEIADAKTLGKYREANYQQDDPYIASRSNKASSQIDNMTKNVYTGMYFKELHEHYDVAPIHNEMIRRSFFQNFVSFTVDAHRIGARFQNFNSRPILGDKVELDFNNSTEVDKIHNGNYIICGITHNFKAFQSYTLDYICVTDGTFGDGILDKKE